MQLLKELLLPIVDSIHNDNSFEQTWGKEIKSRISCYCEIWLSLCEI